MATHPALTAEVRPALALRFVLGVPTADIARLFVVPTARMAARLTLLTLADVKASASMLCCHGANHGDA